MGGSEALGLPHPMPSQARAHLLQKAGLAGQAHPWVNHPPSTAGLTWALVVASSGFLSSRTQMNRGKRREIPFSLSTCGGEARGGWSGDGDQATVQPAPQAAIPHPKSPPHSCTSGLFPDPYNGAKRWVVVKIKSGHLALGAAPPSRSV